MDKRKKILIVIDSLNSGGAEKSLINLLNVLDFSKVTIDLLLFKKEGLYLPLIPKEVNVIDVTKEKRSFLLKGLSFLLHRIRRLLVFFSIKLHPAQLNWSMSKNTIKEVKKKYDYAIAYSQGAPTYFVMTKTKAEKKYSWINTDYNKAGYNSFFDRKYYKSIDRVICVSEKAEEVFISKHPYSKTEIIKDIISEPLIRKMSEEFIDYNFDEGVINILTIGRLVEVKGYDLVVGAAKILKDNNINFKWYIIGEGELRKKIENDIDSNKLSENFKFLGVTCNPYPYMKMMDIYCQPSRFEGFGMAVAEAKVLNKPVVATNFTSITTQIEDQINGVICDISIDSLAKALLKLIKNRELQDEIRNNLRSEKNYFENEVEKIKRLIV